MQLILAIDSDRRQAGQLASLVRSRLKVDLIQATSAGEGLQALQDRVPDLILTSPLLSPFDDGVLDEYLRDLGTAGAHVQTLRIPVLSAAPKKKSAANRLFSLGRQKRTSSAAPDGCDPKVFADEIADYLARAAEDRQATAVRAEPQPVEIGSAATLRSNEAGIEVPALSVAEFEAALSDTEPELPAYEFEPETTVYAPEPIAATMERGADVQEVAALNAIDAVEAAPADLIHEIELPVVEPPPRLLVPIEVRRPVASVRRPDAPPAPKPQAVVAAPEPQAVVAEPEPQAVVAAPEPQAAEPEPQAVVAAPEPQPHVQAPAVVAPVARANGSTSSFEAALAAIRAAWVKSDNKAPAATAPVVPAGTANKGAMPVSKPVGPGSVEVDLTGEIEALEEIDHGDRARGEAPTADAPKAPAVQPRGDTHKKRPEKGRGGRKLRGSGGRPVQDEWGIFDPNQCGFSALVDKLDEVTDSDDAATRAVVTTRVISVR